MFGRRSLSVDERRDSPARLQRRFPNVSAPVLGTMVNSESDAFRANAAHNRALRDELYARVAEAGLGGNEKSRQRHTSRGQLLTRERVEPLLDTGWPFIEIGQHAVWQMYAGEGPGAGMIGGVGRVPCRPGRAVRTDTPVTGGTS